MQMKVKTNKKHSFTIMFVHSKLNFNCVSPYLEMDIKIPVAQ